MKNAITNNSGLLLAIVGVYLGIVFVGPGPMAFAGPAATYADGLRASTGPSEGRPPDQAAEKAIRQFIDTFIEIYRVTRGISDDKPEAVIAGQFDFASSLSVNSKGGMRQVFPSEKDPQPGTYSGRTAEPLRRLHDAFLKRPGDFEDNLKIAYSLTQTEAFFKISLPSKAIGPEVQAAALAAALGQLRSSEESRLRSVILESLTITDQNDQVLIVSRLPRSDLDQLLASPVK